MDRPIVRSLHLRIERINERSFLLISNYGLNVSEDQLHRFGLDFLQLANMERFLSAPTITRRYSGGPIVQVEYELKEFASVARVPL